jgi:eukaryotic-like serine/threonine-protein kinase
MNITGFFLLPEDVIIVPITELSPVTQIGLDAKFNDYVITKLRSRKTSCVIEADAARLVEYFRTPRTIIDAVLNYATDCYADPRDVLEQAFPMIQHMYNNGLIVDAVANNLKATEASLPVTDRILDHEIMKCIHLLEDVELYLVRTNDGQHRALKIGRKGSEKQYDAMFAWEATILRRMAGDPGPVLLDAGHWKGRPFLLLEWYNGVSVSQSAKALREPWTYGSALSLIRLAFRVLKAYELLHRKGIVHGDIHPQNILVSEDGSVKLIDFGLASITDPPEELIPPQRGGIGYYYEPEYALARITNQSPPAPSQLGEQYALAALLYFLFTGEYYIDFKLERDVFWRQIIDEPMIPFTQRGIESWPEIERLLARALCKDPAGRFQSVSSFATELRMCEDAAHVRTSHKSIPISTTSLSKDSELIERVLRRYSMNEKWFAEGLPSPTCSVNFGAAGIAYFYYRMACLRDDPGLLSLANLWVRRALRESQNENAFCSIELDISESTVGTVSLYHTLNGVHFVRALIAHATGDATTLQSALNEFITLSKKQPYKSLDLTIGQSGVLLGCSILLEALGSDSLTNTNALKNLGQESLNTIWTQIERYKPVGMDPNLSFLGLAHGWAGVLYASMRWCMVSEQPCPMTLQPRLAELASLAQASEHGVCWPLRVGYNESWPGWCHGSAGYVHLWTLADRMGFGGHYRDLARGVGTHTWVNSKRSISQMCCGLAGQSYALLTLYRHTDDRKWLKRATILGMKAIAMSKSAYLRPHSLYKGDIGIALLAADLVTPNQSHMPMFEA